MEGTVQVERKLGRCDYRLDVDGKIKPFHANLLKKYVSRDRADTSGSIDVSNVRQNAQGLIDVVSIGVVEEETELLEGTEEDCQNCREKGIVTIPELKGKETVTDVKISKDLSKEQDRQVKELLEEFQDVLTDIPGETNLIEHRIN